MVSFIEKASSVSYEDLSPAQRKVDLMNISNLHEDLNFIFHDSLDIFAYDSDFELLVKLILSPKANEKVNKIGNLLVSKFLI